MRFYREVQTTYYRNAQGQRKNATVWPLGLVQQGVRLYLVCRFEDENGVFWHFSCSVQAEASEESFLGRWILTWQLIATVVTSALVMVAGFFCVSVSKKHVGSICLNTHFASDQAVRDLEDMLGKSQLQWKIPNQPPEHGHFLCSGTTRSPARTCTWWRWRWIRAASRCTGSPPTVG